MQLTVLSAALRGVEATAVRVEVDLAGGLPAFATVGLAEAAVKEARVRVQAAVQNAGFPFPTGRITVNLAPAHWKKEGTGFDLPIAVGVLVAAGVVDAGAVDGALFFGELSLSGEVRPVRGALAAAEAAAAAGCTTLYVAPENAPEAALVKRVAVRACRRLDDVVAVLAGDAARCAPIPTSPARRAGGADDVLDLADVRGQLMPRRALEIAAAGGHALLFVGGPGAGKTMLARRLPGILPPLSDDEALEVTRIRSAAGLNIGAGLATTRPFRAPHHSTSVAGLVGGGTGLPRPGEMSLAHHGVLFLDELPEYARPAIEALREPLETGEVLLSRAGGALRFPARALVVAAMNPCPCGMRGDARRACICTDAEVGRYRARVSGPILDRVDLHVDVPAVDLVALQSREEGEPSRAVAARVLAARAIQARRLGADRTNATMTSAEARVACELDAAGRAHLAAGVEKLGLSARGYDRALKVARTIADLAGAPRVTADHLNEALVYRRA